MQVFSDLLDMGDLSGIAQRMSIRLDNTRPVRVPRKLGRAFGSAFVLRPNGTDHYRSYRDGRRIFAVSWAGHYVFMRALYERDPNTVIRSAIAIVAGGSNIEYGSLEEFDIYAYGTRTLGVGSMVEPRQYQQLQAPGHVRWEDERDLIELAKGVAR